MILVTGASGLLGSHLTKALIKKGHQNIIASIRSTSNRKLIQPFEDQVKWMDGDLTDIGFLDHLLEGVDTVFHTAAMISYDPDDEAALMENNVEVTKNLLNLSLKKGVKRFSFVGSISALHSPASGKPIDESIQWQDQTFRSNYGKSKFLAEREVWRAQSEGLNTVIIHPSIILGSGDWNKGSSSLFKRVKEGLQYYPTGTTGFVAVEDVVKVMLLLEENQIQNERFIVNAENRSYKDIFEQIALALNVKAPSKQGSHTVASAIWRIERAKQFLFKTKPLLTKETVESSMQTLNYNNEKLLKAFPDFEYEKIDEVIRRIAEVYKNEFNP